MKYIWNFRKRFLNSVQIPNSSIDFVRRFLCDQKVGCVDGRNLKQGHQKSDGPKGRVFLSL